MNCPKHITFYSKNILEKLVHLVGFSIRNFFLINAALGVRRVYRKTSSEPKNHVDSVKYGISMEVIFDFIAFGKLKDKRADVLNCQAITYISLIPSPFLGEKNC